jgi:hypothetical protein
MLSRGELVRDGVGDATVVITLGTNDCLTRREVEGESMETALRSSSDAALRGTVGEGTGKTSRSVAAFGERRDMLMRDAGEAIGVVGEEIYRGR